MPESTPRPPLTWGAFRADAIRDYPRVRWEALTDARADALYLWRSGCSQSAIALAYHVSQPAVHRHIAAALLRLRQEHRPEIVYPERPGRIPCVECDTPHLTCFECVARLIHSETGFVTTMQLRRRQVTADALTSRDLRPAARREPEARQAAPQAR